MRDFQYTIKFQMELQPEMGFQKENVQVAIVFQTATAIFVDLFLGMQKVVSLPQQHPFVMQTHQLLGFSYQSFLMPLRKLDNVYLAKNQVSKQYTYVDQAFNHKFMLQQIISLLDLFGVLQILWQELLGYCPFTRKIFWK